MASADADAKPATPPAADLPTEDLMDTDPAPPAEGEEPAEEAKKEEKEEKKEEVEATPQKKRGGRRKKGEAAAAAEKKTPPPSKKSVERPSRERKTVERYAELAPRATPSKKSPAIVQGSGTKLKDIPNVQFKLSKRKADENLQSLHTLLYGRKSNVHFLKRNISQFSGFVWTDNQEKQRNRIKEKLEKFNKEKLLDFCEVLDVNVKVTTKKEEVSAKLLEFLESPCVTRDVVLTDKKKGKKRGRKSKATSEGASAEKKRKRVQKEAAEDGKENDDEDDADPEDASAGEEADGDSEANDHAVSDDEPDEPPAKKKSTDAKKVKKETGSDAKEKDTPGKKGSTKPAKGASKPSQNSKNEPEVEVKKVGKRAKKSKESDVLPDSNKSNKKVSKSKKDDGKETPNNKAARSSNKNKGKDKGGAAAGAAPTTEQLHAVVSSILKEVDFNTATLADILRQLGTHFEMDLMDRKAEVKRIIEEVINSMSDDEGEEDSEDEAEDNGKVEKSKSDPDGGEEK